MYNSAHWQDTGEGGCTVDGTAFVHRRYFADGVLQSLSWGSRLPGKTLDPIDFPPTPTPTVVGILIRRGCGKYLYSLIAPSDESLVSGGIGQLQSHGSLEISISTKAAKLEINWVDWRSSWPQPSHSTLREADIYSMGVLSLIRALNIPWGKISVQ